MMLRSFCQTPREFLCMDIRIGIFQGGEGVFWEIVGMCFFGM